MNFGKNPEKPFPRPKHGAPRLFNDIINFDWHVLIREKKKCALVEKLQWRIREMNEDQLVPEEPGEIIIAGFDLGSPSFCKVDG